MIDRDQLRDDLKWSEGVNATDTPSGRIIEAARLVADPDTLTISKEDGEWLLPEPVGLIWKFILDDIAKARDALLEGQPK